MSTSAKLRPDRLRILIVCTANRCRSPAAEALLWKALVLEGVPAVVRSAGFLDEDHPADPTTVAAMAERGVDLRSHRSTRISAELLDEFDLVLTMERRHAREIVVLGGPTVPVSTFRAFAAGFSRFLRDAPAGATLTQWVATRDPRELAGDDTSSEIADPIGKPLTFHRATIAAIDDTAGDIARVLRDWLASSAAGDQPDENGTPRGSLRVDVEHHLARAPVTTTADYAIPSHVVFRTVEDQMVLLNLQSQQYYGLDPIGADIVMRLLESPATEVISALADTYDADAAILQRDVSDLVDSLLSAGLLVESPPADT
jgi:protein-tyrosine phosphatase